MEVLLIEDVDNLGYAGDVKKVANGYGRNYLLPQKMAILASPGALKQAELVRNAGERRRAQERADAEAIANQIRDITLVFERRSGEMGKLYGSVTSKDIVEKIDEDTGITIDKRKISLAEPIRQLGVHPVNIKLVIDMSVSLNVEVLPEGGILERARQEAKKAAAEAERQAREQALAEQNAAEAAVTAEVTAEAETTVTELESVEEEEFPELDLLAAAAASAEETA